ncbi:MAG: VWA domain-containing protein [Gammaproteobacteria bacterium]|nr:VWA domain-containing protein [Gammaproteobacteria bacterium]
MADDDNLPARSSSRDIRAFVDKSKQVPARTGPGPRGRLIFALDATASRQPTWDRACGIQGDMFRAADNLGGLAVQLCFYRGMGEFSASPWYTVSDDVVQRMTSVFCLGGLTQIGKVLRHTLKEAKKSKINALVFIGDCVEEDPDQLAHLAGQIGILGVPVFLFHEGNDPNTIRVFRQIAQLTRGAACPFDHASAGQLRDLLSAVAVYASGGRRALEKFSEGRHASVKQLTRQLDPDR